MGIETIDIGSEARAFRLRQGGDRAFVGCVGKFAEAGPAAVQRRLDGRVVCITWPISSRE
jgi:hypothetical protein